MHHFKMADEKRKMEIERNKIVSANKPSPHAVANGMSHGQKEIALKIKMPHNQMKVSLINVYLTSRLPCLHRYQVIIHAKYTTQVHIVKH